MDAAPQTAPQAAHLKRRLRQARLRKARRWFLAALVSVLATAVAVGFAFAGSAGTIALGITVAGVPIGGLTTDEAVRALQQHARAGVDKPQTFLAGEQEFRFTARQLGVSIDWRASVEQARRHGDGFGAMRGFRRLELRFAGKDVMPAIHSYDTIVASAMKAIALKVDRPRIPAAISLQGVEPSIVPGRTGFVLDQQAAGIAVVGALASAERDRPVVLPLHVEGVRASAASLAPVLSTLRTMLSAPVRLRYQAAYAAVTPAQLASMVEVPAPGSSALTLGGPAADRILARLSKLVDRPPTDATFDVDASGRPVVVPGLEGRTLDRVKTSASILAAAAQQTERLGDLVVAAALPKHTTAQAVAMGINEVVGTYETTYGGIWNRLQNVRLVAKLVDDHFIAPGQTFSFNRATGERSAAKGFLQAPVIVNGELQTGLGGGVCQVSTTVFNAAFEAGLPITARTNHALYISHYPLGRDATVDYPGTDLQFKNDTDHWIWLRTFIGDTSLRVTLYGTSPHRKVESTTAPLRVTGAVPIKKVDDPTLPKGKQVIDPDQSSSPPMGTSVHRIVYDETGKVLYDSVWYSGYLGVPEIMRVGTKAKPVNPGATDTTGAIIALH